MTVTTKLIFVRHGETEGNVNGVWNGVTDAPLTARGRIQIDATGRYLADLVVKHPIDHFYVSPMGRAQKTAAAIAQTIAVQPTIDAELREFDLGDWEGRSMQELGEQEKLWERWAKDPRYAPPNGESPWSFGQRAAAGVQRLVDMHVGQTVLAVTHGGIIGYALGIWLGDGPRDWVKYEPHNCAIAILERRNDKWHAIMVNDISHLPAEAIAYHAEPYG